MTHPSPYDPVQCIYCVTIHRAWAYVAGKTSDVFSPLPGAAGLALETRSRGDSLSCAYSTFRRGTHSSFNARDAVRSGIFHPHPPTTSQSPATRETFSFVRTRSASWGARRHSRSVLSWLEAKVPPLPVSIAELRRPRRHVRYQRSSDEKHKRKRPAHTPIIGAVRTSNHFCPAKFGPYRLNFAVRRPWDSVDET